VLFCLKREKQPASEMLCVFKKLDDGKLPKKTNVSINFLHALFSLLDFLNLEGRTASCPKMSVRNYHSMLCSISEECRSHMIW
jgi:hypothetical protein